MILQAFLLAVSISSPAEPLQTKIVEAAVFKNGMASVVREGRIAKGKHRYDLDILPDAYDGTFWYSIRRQSCGSGPSSPAQPGWPTICLN